MYFDFLKLLTEELFTLEQLDPPYKSSKDEGGRLYENILLLVMLSLLEGRF